MAADAITLIQQEEAAQGNDVAGMSMDGAGTAVFNISNNNVTDVQGVGVAYSAFGNSVMRKENFAIGQRVRLKWELDTPVSIPAGAIGQVTRVSPWDEWVRFEKRVVRLPFSDVEQAGFTLDRQRRILDR